MDKINSDSFLISEFFAYVRHPTTYDVQKFSLVSNIKYLIWSYVFCLFGVMIAGFMILALDYALVHYIGVSSIYQQIKQTNQGVKVYYGQYAFAIIAFLVPLIEESIFRLPLIAQKYSISLATSLLLFRFLGNSLTVVDIKSSHYWFSLLFTLVFFVSLNYLLPTGWIQHIRGRYFRLWYYLLVVSFALVHISNIKHIVPHLFAIYPFFVLPQLVMGFFLAHIRMHRGFIWGVALHGLINSVSFLFR